MKKIIAMFVILLTCIFLTACGNAEPKEISCEDIIEAYENAGYTVKYHDHRYADSDSDIVCNMQIEDPNDPEKNYIYIDRYSDDEKAEMAAEDGKYNIAIWFVFAVSGESRWLTSEHYGNIHYHTFDKKMLKPLEGLIK